MKVDMDTSDENMKKMTRSEANSQPSGEMQRLEQQGRTCTLNTVPSATSKLLQKNIAENDFDISDEDESDVTDNDTDLTETDNECGHGKSRIVRERADLTVDNGLQVEKSSDILSDQAPLLNQFNSAMPVVDSTESLNFKQGSHLSSQNENEAAIDCISSVSYQSQTVDMSVDQDLESSVCPNDINNSTITNVMNINEMETCTVGASIASQSDKVNDSILQDCSVSPLVELSSNDQSLLSSSSQAIPFSINPNCDNSNVKCLGASCSHGSLSSLNSSCKIRNKDIHDKSNYDCYNNGNNNNNKDYNKSFHSDNNISSNNTGKETSSILASLCMVQEPAKLPKNCDISNTLEGCLMDSATQTEDTAPSPASSFHSISHMSQSSSFSSELCHAKNSKEKLLIYTWGSDTYIPHKIGIKRMKASDFCKVNVIVISRHQRNLILRLHFHKFTKPEEM